MFVYRVSEETNRFDFSRIRIPTLGVFLNSHKVYLYIVFKLYFLALAFNFLITTTMISRNFAISLHSLSLEFPRHLPLLLPLSLPALFTFLIWLRCANRARLQHKGNPYALLLQKTATRWCQTEIRHAVSWLRHVPLWNGNIAFAYVI